MTWRAASARARARRFSDPRVPRPLSGRRDCEEQGPSQKDAFPPTAYEIYGTCLQLFILGSLT